MRIIEPCCATRHMMQLRDAISGGGTVQFEGYGDLSLVELLPAILTRYSETEMMIVAPSLPDLAAGAVGRWMKKQWARKDGTGMLDVVSRLTVIADLSEKKSPMASGWVRDNPFPGRLVLCDIRQKDTAILLPDFAITGPVNMRYGYHFVATATADGEQIRNLWERYAAMTVRKAGDRKDEDSTVTPSGNGDADAGQEARDTGATASVDADAATDGHKENGPAPDARMSARKKRRRPARRKGA